MSERHTTDLDDVSDLNPFLVGYSVFVDGFLQFCPANDLNPSMHSFREHPAQDRPAVGPPIGFRNNLYRYIFDCIDNHICSNNISDMEKITYLTEREKESRFNAQTGHERS